MEKCLGVIGPLISAFIDFFYMSHFFETNYKRRMKNKRVYRTLFPCCVIMIAGVNSFHRVWMNLLVWIMICFLMGQSLYHDEKEKWQNVFCRAILLFIANLFIELISYYGLRYMIKWMDAAWLSNEIYQFLNLTVTKSLNILLYFTVLKKLLGKRKLQKLPMGYSVCYIILALSTFLSTIVVINAMEHTGNNLGAILMILYPLIIMATNLFVLSLLDYLAENMELKMQLNILKQQQNMQQKYYSSLKERYNCSLKVLHDVDKHIRSIEGLHISGKNRQAMEYTREISHILLPLIPTKYVDNDVLNIILNDKREIAEKYNIDFRCSIEEADYDFLRNTDITTIFSNLLDNAIEACMERQEERFIHLIMMNQKDMVLVKISNSIENPPLRAGGRPVSGKGEYHGIGLRNVECAIENYGGIIQYDVKDKEFICLVYLNRP